MARLRSRFDDHLSRKIFHIIVGTCIAYLYAYLIPRKFAVLGVLAALAIYVPFEFLRLRNRKLNQWVLKNMGALMREEEKSEPTASLHYILGLAWALVFLPKVIGIQAILTLSWMDPIAGIFGLRIGRTPWNALFQKFFVDLRRLQVDFGAKTVEGSLAGFLAAVIAGLIAWTGPWAAYPINGGLWWPTVPHIFLFSIFGAMAAMMAEGWPTQWDDNANIPFWTGLAVWAGALIWGVPLAF